MEAKVHNQMAKEAYERVAQIKEEKGTAGDFRSLARSFPSMIQVNGLGCAITYLYAKKGTAAYGHLYAAIDSWLQKSLEGKTSYQKNHAKELNDKNAQAVEFVQRISLLTNMEYRLYTNEVMNFCLWIKRFAEGMLGEQKNAEQEQAATEQQQ